MAKNGMSKEVKAGRARRLRRRPTRRRHQISLAFPSKVSSESIHGPLAGCENLKNL
jgi:hypothetical protein